MAIGRIGRIAISYVRYGAQAHVKWFSFVAHTMSDRNLGSIARVLFCFPRQGSDNVMPTGHPKFKVTPIGITVLWMMFRYPQLVMHTRCLVEGEDVVNLS